MLQIWHLSGSTFIWSSFSVARFTKCKNYENRGTLGLYSRFCSLEPHKYHKSESVGPWERHWIAWLGDSHEKEAELLPGLVTVGATRKRLNSFIHQPDLPLTICYAATAGPIWTIFTPPCSRLQEPFPGVIFISLQPAVLPQRIKNPPMRCPRSPNWWKRRRMFKGSQ